MKIKGNEKFFVEEQEDIVDNKYDYGYEDEYQGGMKKIKTTIGKMKKQEDFQYRHQDLKRFKKK
jgi:hypothetical protein